LGARAGGPLPCLTRVRVLATGKPTSCSPSSAVSLVLGISVLLVGLPKRIGGAASFLFYASRSVRVPLPRLPLASHGSSGSVGQVGVAYVTNFYEVQDGRVDTPPPPPSRRSVYVFYPPRSIVRFKQGVADFFRRGVGWLARTCLTFARQ